MPTRKQIPWAAQKSFRVIHTMAKESPALDCTALACEVSWRHPFSGLLQEFLADIVIAAWIHMSLRYPSQSWRENNIPMLHTSFFGGIPENTLMFEQSSAEDDEDFV